MIKNDNFILISPVLIKGGFLVTNNYESLELYKNMNIFTTRFIEKEINYLMQNAKNNTESKDYLTFHLLFCGNFNDLQNNSDDFMDFIEDNKERIIAIYRYDKERDLFTSCTKDDITFYHDYIYLNLAKILEEFKKYDIDYKLDIIRNNFSTIYRSDTSTRFIISYNPIKEKTKLNKLIK